MSDERYKEGFNKYLHHFGVNVEEDNKWKNNRIKQESKRLNIALLIPMGVGVFLLSLHYGLIILQFTDEALIWSWWTYGIGAFLFAAFSIKGKRQLADIKRLKKSFLKSWRRYVITRRRESILLIIGVFPLGFSLINLSYDTKGQLWVKIVITILVGLAAAHLLKNYFSKDYDFLAKESTIPSEYSSDSKD